MTWNIRSLRDDRDTVVDVVRRFAPDVLFVQEAPRFFRARSKLAALARESGLVVASGGRPAAEVAMLTHLRVEVTAARQLGLSKTPGLHHRGVACARLTIGTREFLAISLHLGLDPAERIRHAAEVRDLVAAEPGPAPGRRVVIAGDVNEQASAPAWRMHATG
jgi:endonuclease/exonuclease/phosphatase family metal-dependent hydrolase